jgi:hypothetical protein
VVSPPPIELTAAAPPLLAVLVLVSAAVAGLAALVLALTLELLIVVAVEKKFEIVSSVLSRIGVSLEIPSNRLSVTCAAFEEREERQI